MVLALSRVRRLLGVLLLLLTPLVCVPSRLSGALDRPIQAEEEDEDEAGDKEELSVAPPRAGRGGRPRPLLLATQIPRRTAEKARSTDAGCTPQQRRPQPRSAVRLLI